MCKRAECPNDGRPTWWGCGAHIEMALAGVPEEDRCDCPHEPVPGRPGMYQVKVKPKTEERGETGGGKRVEIGYEN